MWAFFLFHIGGTIRTNQGDAHLRFAATYENQTEPTQVISIPVRSTALKEMVKHLATSRSKRNPFRELPTLPPARLPATGVIDGVPPATDQVNQRIPHRIFFTSRFASLKDSPRDIQLNLQHTLELNPHFEVTWFDNAACVDFLTKREPRLLPVFNMATLKHAGMFMSDICRAAYLFHEGGWYTDLDVQIDAPFASLVDANTSFLSAWAAHITPRSSILNAIIGVEAKSPVIGKQIDRMVSTVQSDPKWLDGPINGIFWGPETLLNGLQDHMRSCGENERDVDMEPDFLACGSKVRMLEEVNLLNPVATKTSQQIIRATTRARRGEHPRGQDFPGRMFALFYNGAHEKHVGYPRFDACSKWGCGSLVQNALVELRGRKLLALLQIANEKK